MPPIGVEQMTVAIHNAKVLALRLLRQRPVNLHVTPDMADKALATAMHWLADANQLEDNPTEQERSAAIRALVVQCNGGGQ